MAYLARGELNVELLGRGIAWLDTGTPASLLEASSYIATIEQQQGLKIACLEEIAFTQFFIDEQQLQKLIEEIPNPEYSAYLKIVLGEGRQKAK